MSLSSGLFYFRYISKDLLVSLCALRFGLSLGLLMALSKGLVLSSLDSFCLFSSLVVYLVS